MDKPAEKGSVLSLMRAIAENETQKEAKFCWDYVMDSLEKFSNYLAAVYFDVNNARICRTLRDEGQITQEEFEWRITESDKRRRSVHNVAIDACNGLNRLCDKYGIAHFCPEEGTPREDVAAFIGAFVTKVYGDGIKKDIKDFEVFVEESEDMERT